MKYRVAINGYGRIGQSVLRAIYASPYRSIFSIVAINDLADIETLTYLTRYDTTHGRFPYSLSYEDNILRVGNDAIAVFQKENARALDWNDLAIDLLFECSGTSKASEHILAGAPRILLSRPLGEGVDATIVYGYNEKDLQPKHRIVSNASCTTNCIVPILNLLDQNFGIVNGVTTTIHSAMNDQPVIDSYHRTNLRLTRSALHSIIPVETELAKGLDRLMPQLSGCFECLHVRVPTINVSAMDLSINLKKEVTKEELNQLIAHHADSTLKGLVGYSEEPHASVDFNSDPHSAVFDGSQTRVCCGSLAKLFCWFDNEWGFASRMLDVAAHWLNLAVPK